MRKSVCLVVIILALCTGAANVFAQTSNHKYEVTLFGTLPPGQTVWNLPRSIAADGKGKIYLLRASEPPVLEFDRDGKLLKTWGQGMFKEAHSIDIDRDGNLWITDRADNQVFKFSPEGKQLMVLGKKGIAGKPDSPDLFNGSADVAFAPNGDFFVADGQGGNNRIVKFSKDGKFIKFWGGKGSAAGQFETPHSIAIDSKGRVLVADQQEKKTPRIQIFDQDGKFLEQWDKLPLKQPTGLFITKDDTVYIGDMDGNAVFVVKDGKLLDTIGDVQARPHNVAVDPGTGVIYFADPITPLYAGTAPVKAGVDRDPGGFFKQIIRKK